MPAPTSHTESSLLALMEDEVGPVGGALGLLDTDALLRAVYSVERLLGVAVASVPTADMAKLETIARWLAWRAAKAAAVGEFDLKAGTVSLTSSQVFKHVSAMYADAEAAASVYPEVVAASGAGGVAVVTSLTSSDPYSPYDEFA